MATAGTPTATLSPDEAERAIYIDFDGRPTNRLDQPMDWPKGNARIGTTAGVEGSGSSG